MTDPAPVLVIGGGLAGVETAWRLARAGFPVRLKEMRPGKTTPAHTTAHLAELVCSNSLRAEAPTSAVGLLKEELARMGSLVMAAAQAHRVPAGKALAVEREGFAREVTERLLALELVELVQGEAVELPRPGQTPTALATGPLTSPSLAQSLAHLTGERNLHFYDAIAPIVETASVDQSKAFWASRYADPALEADYLNCPLDQEEYHRFHLALMAGERVPLRDFEEAAFFEGCLPIEVMAERGESTLAFGPMKPVGLVDPRTGRRPFAVVQLRKEDPAGEYLNLVGFQTRLKHAAQKEVFRLIPGLEGARFARMGSVHRNTFVQGPKVLATDLSLRKRTDLFLAGQLSGVEGYVESAAAGLLVGEFIRQRLAGEAFNPPPRETALGALLAHPTASPAKRFQPSNINFSLFLPLEGRVPKRERPLAYLARAREALDRWLAELNLGGSSSV